MKADPSFYLKGVTLSNGDKVTFSPGELLLVVGPNNAGKSTFLRNIKDAATNYRDARQMLPEVMFETTPDAIKNRLRQVYRVQENPQQWYILDKKGRLSASIYTDYMQGDKLTLEDASDAFVIQLNAETRLSLSKPVETLDLETERPSHPYHHFMLSRGLLRNSQKL